MVKNDSEIFLNKLLITLKDVLTLFLLDVSTLFDLVLFITCLLSLEFFIRTLLSSFTPRNIFTSTVPLTLILGGFNGFV